MPTNPIFFGKKIELKNEVYNFAIYRDFHKMKIYVFERCKNATKK